MSAPQEKSAKGLAEIRDMKSTLLNNPVGATTLINGQSYDYYGGCGYLGLQSHPQVLQAAAEAVLRFGLSTANSRGGLGESPVYDELEKQACAFFDCEKILYFASGYLGAAILLQSESRPSDHFFIDSDAHFSLWDAAAMCNRMISPFAHGEPTALEKTIANELQTGERPIVLTDGLFPISGEIAPLPAYLELVRQKQGLLVVDDAHAVGALGTVGRGTFEYFGIDDPCCRVTATFNKALGGFGGVIYGRQKLLENIERNSRVLAGSSPPPLPAAAASAKALELLRATPEWMESLRKNVRQAREGLSAQGWRLSADSPSPILCLPGRDGVNLFHLRDRLFERQIAVEFVNSYPSAPAGGALRLAICAAHTSEQIERLIRQIAEIVDC